MSYVLTVAIVLAVVVTATLVVLLRRLSAREQDAHADLEWSSEFSIAKYRPMERLF